MTQAGPSFSIATFSSVRAARLLKAIDALAAAPEAKAEVFAKMRAEVTKSTPG